MLISIIKELLGTKMTGCNDICQTLTDDEHESSNVAFREKLRSASHNINLDHTKCIPIYNLPYELWYLWTLLSLPQ